MLTEVLTGLVYSLSTAAFALVITSRSVALVRQRRAHRPPEPTALDKRRALHEKINREEEDLGIVPTVFDDPPPPPPAAALEQNVRRMRRDVARIEREVIRPVAKHLPIHEPSIASAAVGGGWSPPAPPRPIPPSRSRYTSVEIQKGGYVFLRVPADASGTGTVIRLPELMDMPHAMAYIRAYEEDLKGTERLKAIVAESRDYVDDNPISIVPSYSDANHRVEVNPDGTRTVTVYQSSKELPAMFTPAPGWKVVKWEEDRGYSGASYRRKFTVAPSPRPPEMRATLPEPRPDSGERSWH
jgi:hypothetical protein